MCECYWDNPPAFYDRRIVKGRKEHKCDECLRVIEKGEEHEYAKGVWEGDFSDFRTCQTCLDMIKEIDLHCYCHGVLMDEIDECDFAGVQSVADFQQRRRVNYSLSRIAELEESK